MPAGFCLHEYRIDSVLGQGGFGITYLATDINLNTRFAIKEYLPADAAIRVTDGSVYPRWPEDGGAYQAGLDGFLVEARTLASFRHPHIVRVARFFEAHHTAYIVQEYERGQSLKAWWQSHRTLPGVHEYAGYAPVIGHDWVVGITEPRSQFEEPLNHLFQNVLRSVAVVGVIFMLLAWLFARSIMGPILRLTNAANALKMGDYDRATIRVGSDDEIGRLARTFNVMIDVLRQRERERRRGRPGA